MLGKQLDETDLAGRDSDLAVILRQGSSTKLLNGSEWPADPLEGKLESTGNINDDLLLSRLLLRLDLLDVISANVSNISGNVQEANCGDLQSDNNWFTYQTQIQVCCIHIS